MSAIQPIPNDTPEPAAQPFTVGEPLPKAMGPREMQRAFGISSATFRLRRSRGEFKPFELPRRIGLKWYSGERVQSFLNGRK